MGERIMVPFHGDGEGVEELTWAQIGLWYSMALSGRSGTMGGVATPPDDSTTVTQMADLLGFVVGRHQALRTRLRMRPTPTEMPQQVCSSSGEVALEVVDADDDPAAVADAVFARYKETNFDYENEWPIRMAVVRHRDVITHIVVVYLHVALDAGGLAALVADMVARDPVTGAAAAPVTAIQPLEQARRQRGRTARRQSAAAMTYLEHVLRTMNPAQFGEPRYEGNGIRMIRFRSPATALAIRRIAVAEEMNSASVLVAVFAVGLARFRGLGQVMAMLMVNNRFRPGFAESVSPLVQLSPYLIDVADVSLGEAFGRARASVLSAYKNAYYDPFEQEAVMERVEAERGPMDYSCVYNDRRATETVSGQALPTDPLPTDDEIRAAVASAEHTWEYRPDMSHRRLFLTVEDGPDAVDFVLSADTRFFSEADIVELTREFETVAVTTALTPELPTGVRTRATVSVGDPG